MSSNISTVGVHNDRQVAELELLLAMYPDQLLWHDQRQELTYTSNAGALLTLRLGDDYPQHGKPILISASNHEKHDLREGMRKATGALAVEDGEEILDAMIQIFEDLQVAKVHRSDLEAGLATPQHVEESKTTVVWLHHLLNTNKRKLATNPTFRSSDIVGLTKPGYPGVLVYSGNAKAVDSHVSELKDQRWQAFQIRLEEYGPESWAFSHTSGIKEVETMAEASLTILNDSQRQTFLKAMNIK